MRRAALVLVWIPVLAMSCSTCQPPPDPDGTSPGAQALVIGRWHRDTLDCGEGDCADWYHFETAAGALRIEVAKVAEEDDDEDEVPEFSVAVADAEGGVLAEASNAGEASVRFRYPEQKGRYTPAQKLALAVQAPPESDVALDYEVRVTFTAKPLPPPPPRVEIPRFRTVKAALLEVETRQGGEAVLIDQGSRSGIAPGHRGRLLVGGIKIADFEIVDVYPDGSRAAIRGSLGAALTADAVAEVDVPL